MSGSGGRIPETIRLALRERYASALSVLATDCRRSITAF